MNKQTTCQICGSWSITTFLERKQVPVHQNVIIQTEGSAKEVNRGNLILGVCETCGFIFNQDFQPSKLSYGGLYDNSQMHSRIFDEYVCDLARYLMSDKKVQNCRIVEIGCGKGFFLRKLVGAEGAGNIGYGYDPSYVGPLVDCEGRLRFETRYYGARDAEVPADVIICRHVIEHVADPVNLLRTIKTSLGKVGDGRVFVETPCVEWILRNQVIWDLLYEHCCYFSAGSLRTAFEIAGLEVDSIGKVFGGQYLWVEARVATKQGTFAKNGSFITDLAKQFGKSDGMLRNFLSRKLRELAGKGGIALWGAGGKGVTLANLLDPECKWISCVVDLNPNKQGCYLPGTGHPIIGYKELGKYGVSMAILMNPNYGDENRSLLRESGLAIELVDLSEWLKDWENNG